MLDGFDTLAMSFSASGVKAAWSLQNSQLGALSAILAPLASGALLDRGRAPSRLTAALPGAGAVTGTGR